MSIAAPTTALPVQASPAPPEKGGASSKPEAPDPEFGRMFRAQVGPVQRPAVGTAASAIAASAGTTVAQDVARNEVASAMAGKGATTDSTGPVAPVVMPTSDVAGQPSPNQAQAVPAEAADATVLPGSAAALLRRLLGSELHDGGSTDLRAGSSNVIPSLSALNVPQKPDKSAEGASLTSARGTLANHKAQKAKEPGSAKTEKAAPVPIPGQAPLSVVLPASVPPPLPIAPELIAVAPGKLQAGPPPTKDSIAGNGAPSQIASLPGELAGTPPADGLKPDLASKAASSSAGPGPLRREAAPLTANSGKVLQAAAPAAPHSGLAPHGNHAPSQKMPHGLAAESSSFGAHVALHSAEAPAPPVAQIEQPRGAAAASAASGAGSPNLYDRIDQGVAPVVLHSGAQHVAVGLHDPGLGWVEIQTQSAAGHVEATLVTASVQSHASLATQLPAMAQFLEQRDVRLGMLAVHHDMSGSSAGSSGNGSGYGAGAHHSGSENPSGGAPRYTGLSPGGLRSGQGAGAAARGGDDGPALRPVSYISVRA